MGLCVRSIHAGMPSNDAQDVVNACFPNPNPKQVVAVSLMALCVRSIHAGMPSNDAQEVVNAALALVNHRNTGGVVSQAIQPSYMKGGVDLSQSAEQLTLWVCLLAAVGQLTDALLCYIRTGSTSQVCLTFVSVSVWPQWGVCLLAGVWQFSHMRCCAAALHPHRLDELGVTR